jgi:hypothetical protein
MTTASAAVSSLAALRQAAGLACVVTAAYLKVATIQGLKIFSPLPPPPSGASQLFSALSHLRFTWINMDQDHSRLDWSGYWIGLFGGTGWSWREFMRNHLVSIYHVFIFVS